jgi:GNAT superfamily N-acetyltransferase
MLHSIETPATLTDRDEVDEIIREFYTLQTSRLHAGGGPKVSPDLPVRGFWAEVEKYLPPNGAMVFARDATGRIVGCGGMNDIGGGIAELKYLFVRPETRGTGLGRRLVQERIDIAHARGLAEIRVDTLKVSVEMHALYESMGFERVDSFAESKSLRDVPQIAPFMYFYRMAL